MSANSQSEASGDEVSTPLSLRPMPRGGGHHAGRSLPWAAGVAGGAIMAIGLVLMFLLAQATNNRELYEQNYQRLLYVNAGVAAILLLTIGWVSWRLYSRLRRGRFGSRLLVKLAAVFALVGLLPGTLIYVVSYQFVSRSIETWFDVKVEGALDAGLNLGRTTLDTLSADLAQKARGAAPQVAEWPENSMGLPLERLREQLGVSDAVVWNANAQMLASAGTSRFSIAPDRPSSTQLRQVRAQRVLSQIEGLDDTSGDPSTAGQVGSNPRIKVIALVNPASFGISGDARFLQLTQSLPQGLVANALAVTQANREYQERALGRDGLRRMYIGTLTLTLFLAVFGAVLLAVLLGNQLVQPLLVLADGVRQVAAGDLSPKAALVGKDELGGLTRSFADMTQQLSDARGQAQRSMAQLDASRANVQTILDNLTAGVIVLDAQGRIQSSNPGATRILRAPVAAYHGHTLAEVPHLEAFGRGVQAEFEEMLGVSTLHGLDHWQQSFDLGSDTHGGTHAVNLIARGAVMTGDRRLLVFDDISEVVSAQRAQAWAEVARRLAHEIKNPLTPIQLSAERLAMKLGGKLGDPDQAILNKSVKTIVDQVDAMKRLVNEFRDYARLPAAQLLPVQLNPLLEEVLSMYASEAAREGSARVPVRLELDPQCPAILGDPQQLRQVIHNLVQNAQDATEGMDGSEVLVRTQWSSTSQRVRLMVRDSGSGFPESILKRAFEPYVTTKAKGTGLGLAVVKKIVDEHGARLEIGNRQFEGHVVGAQVSISFPVAPIQQSPQT